MSDTVSNNPLGGDSIKGGIFFGSNLTPAGTFSNIPQTTAVPPASSPQEAKLILTLQQVKEDLQKNATLLASSTTDILSETALNTFLQSYVQLLIDRTDMRNYIFFGSAYTELNYHINYLITNYPYKSFFAKDVTTGLITLTPQSGNNTLVTFAIIDILQVANYSFDNSGDTQWLDYDLVDKNGTRFPILANPTTFSTPGQVDFLVDGNISINNFVEYIPSIGVLFKGLIISPKLVALNDFSINLDPIQKELISPTNPTPWPREPITNNLIITGTDYDNWIEDPANMAAGFKVDEDSVISLIGEGLPFTAGLTLDETETNQLIRRAIPHRLIDELRDTEDKFFSRFILLAGKMFDTIKVYIDFLKYTKELNYTPFNQLSPDYYRLYAEHYGFDLFDDENISLAQTIIKTEPGLGYDGSNNAIYNNQDTAQTQRELQNEKQKRLLINLFYLYSTKGTLKCIDVLARLLGSPEGLVVFNDLAFNQTTNQKFTENEKIKIPQIAYEIDPDYLIDSVNVNNPVNMPYVYRLKLDNENIINLRELEGYTDPNGAIQQQVLDYGTKTYAYGYFKPNSFATLQNNDTTNPDGYYLLPLTFPDKYCGVTVEYMLPRDGYVKGVGQNLDETSIHLASLYKVDGIVVPPLPAPQVPDLLPATNKYAYKIPQAFMESIISVPDTTTIPFSASFVISTLQTLGTTLEVKIGLVGFETTIGATTWKATKKATALAIVNAINFTQTTDDYIAFYKEDAGGLSFTITVESQREFTAVIAFSQSMVIWTNGSLDPNNLPNSQIMSNGVYPVALSQFLMARLEGKDLVVRVHLRDEYGMLGWLHRIALLENVFATDGLNHELRLIYRPEGVEVYQDFHFIGLALWHDPTTLIVPLNAWDCPKNQITLADILPLPNIFAYPDDETALVPNDGDDTPYWWDLFVGLPIGVNMFFKRVAVQEQPSINHPDSLDFGIDTSGQEVEKFSFNFENQIKDIDNNYLLNSISVPCEYKSPNPFPASSVEPDVIDLTFSSYTDGIVADLRLVNQTYLHGEVSFSQDIQNYFNLPNGEVITMDSLFKFNGWAYSLHQDYTYENYNKVFTNYQVFAEQVLTYLALLPFMELIEGRFKQLVSQFIPIVINLSNFGRLIKSLERLKVHYPAIYKDCEGSIIGSGARGVFRIVHGSNNEYASINNNLTIRIEITKFITNASNTTPIVITTLTEHNLTSASIVDVDGVSGNSAANVIANPITVLSPTTFQLDTTVGNGAYTGGGIVIDTPVIMMEAWHGSNVLTAETTATNFSLIDAMFTATNNLSGVTIDVDPTLFQAAFIHEINDCILYLEDSENVQTDSVQGFSGGYPSIAGTGCFTITVTNPLPAIIGNNLQYIYYAAEQALKIYIYLDSEVFIPEPYFYIQ